jgi:hypothetical protein
MPVSLTMMHSEVETMAEAPMRVNFFDGMLLTGDDLRVEQDYCRRMRYLHNRLHGHGVVEGLEVTLERKGSEVRVSPGWALDALGREIVLAEERCLPVPEDRVADIVVAWAEAATQPVPARPDDATLYLRWVEEPELSVVPRGKQAEDALLLGRDKRGRLGKLSLDLSVRRTLGRV